MKGTPRATSRGLGLGLLFLTAGCGKGAEAHRPFPQIVNSGDAALSPLRVVTLVAAGDPDAAHLFAFGDALVASAWYKAVGADYSLFAAGPSVHLTGEALSPNAQGLSDAAINAYITTAIRAAPTPPTPDGHTVYLLYLPPSVAIAGNRNCVAGYGGFHEPYGQKGDNLAVVQRCPAEFESEFDQITISASHEILESATDPGNQGWGLQPVTPPWKGSVWASGDGGTTEEVGDLCEGTRVREGGFYYQRIFSNTAAKKGDDPCVPALTAPYYNLFSGQDWYSGKAGASVSIPITAWSTAVLPPWVISASIANSSDSMLTFTPTVLRTSSTIIGGVNYNIISSGGQAAVQVQIPAGAPHGAWALINLVSSRIDATHPNPAADDDDLHLWLTGVYVP